MSLRLGDDAPNFKAKTSLGEIDFYEYLGDSWGVLFSHPADYTPVCTTELGKTASLKEEFAKRNVKVIALSVADTTRSNHKSMTMNSELIPFFGTIATFLPVFRHGISLRFYGTKRKFEMILRYPAFTNSGFSNRTYFHWPSNFDLEFWSPAFFNVKRFSDREINLASLGHS